MNEATVARGDAAGLPPELQKAQEALRLPEVQDMLRKLSAYNLGVFMPHQHDEETGRFDVLPDDTVQVEMGLKVSFKPAKLCSDPARFVPVGWVWHDDGVHASAMCKMVCVTRPGDTMHYSEHQSVEDEV
jgi:hypothetical protein